MNFQASVEYLLSLGNEVSAMKLGLQNISKLLAALGDPQNKYLKVQVAGTNGKGSVCAFLNSICVTAEIRTGMFTSPHLVSITERVQIDGHEIPEKKFAELASVVRNTSELLVEAGDLESVPTYFEQVTAIALVAFAEANVELAILETGLGGRLDATTAANAEICAITQIDIDHQQYLGETIEEIAAEKAAIIREGARVCVGRQRPEALEVILQRCSDVGVVPKTLGTAKWEKNPPGFDFVLDGFRGEELVLSLEGEHQAENAALAILLSLELRRSRMISDEHIIRGVANTRHPGRLEWFECDGVLVLLDGAHNPAGAESLVAYLTSQSLDRSIVLVYGSMNDKDYESILKTISPIATDMILTEPKNQRAISATEIAEWLQATLRTDNVFVVQDVEQAFDSAVEIARTYPNTRRKLVLVTGSLYLVGEVRRILTAALPSKLKTES